MFQRRSTTRATGTRRFPAPAAAIRRSPALRAVLAALTLVVSAGAGFAAGNVGAAPSAAPTGAAAQAPAAQTTERLATLRIYGETNVCTNCVEGEGNRPVTAGSNTAVDPNTGNVPEDPPYTDPSGPFDPLSDEAPEHDYVTWNPAWIYEQLGDRRLQAMWPGLDGIDEVSRQSAIRMGGINGSEKVWLRHWYEPTRLDKDLNADSCLTDLNNNGQPDAALNPTPTNVDEWYPAIMTELTYMLLENDVPEAVPAPRDLDDSAPRPACGRAGGTRIVFPVGTDEDALDPSGDLTGRGLTSLDVDFDGRNDMVNVASEASLAGDLGVNLDFDGDGTLDQLSGDGVPLSCDDLAVLHTDAVTLGRGDTLQFIDHFVKIQSVADSSAVLQVWYNGDLLPRLVQVRSIGIGAAALAADVGPLQVVQPGGGNLGSVPIGPWFVFLQDADVRDGTVTLMAGRAIGAPCASMEGAPNVPNRSAGGPWFLKRFYVDGHEYNVVALHTCSADEIQYITLRAPLPKVDVTIEQHSVRLEGYAEEESLALPPPFNHEHTILEDVVAFEAFDPIEIEPGDEPIDRPDILYMGGPIGPVAPILHDEDPLSYTGRDPDHPVGPYQDYLASHWFYVDEDVNRSFLGQLREKYGAIANDITAPPGGLAASEGFFFNEQIFTRPWNFTEFVLPNQPDPADDPATGEPPYDPDNYYLTSGWINPTARWRVWQMPDAGVPAQIPPIPPDLAINNDRYDTATDTYGAPRRASIEFDPDQPGKVILDQDGTRLFGGFPIDDWLDDLRICSDAGDRPSIRYGAGDVDVLTDSAGLPVEVLPYTDPFAPFNPQHPDAPRTDSLTFNPAYMDEFRNTGEDLRGLYRQLSNNGANAREKVYHRLWYQPDYVTKIRDPQDCDRDLSFLAMMQEFTYLTMDTTDNPIALPPGVSRLAFPIGTRASELPVPRRGGTLPAGGAFGYGLTTFDADFDGADEAVTIHTEQTLQGFLDTQWQSNRPMIPGVPVLPLAGPVLDFDGDGGIDDLDADCVSLNGNELVVFAVESIVLDLDANTTESGAAMFLDHMVVLENVTPGSRAQFRVYFTGGNPANARPEVIGGVRSLDIGDAAIADRFQDRVTLVRPGQQNPGTDGAWFVFLEDVATDAERVTITVGRALGATHSAIDDGAGNHDLTPGDPWYLKRFYVDGHEYNVVALMTQTAAGENPVDPAVCNNNFAFITIRTPVPKGNYFNPQDSLFQQGYFLDGLPAEMSVMPPFNVDHTIAVDVERMAAKDFANLGSFDRCVGDLAAAEPLVETIVEEAREPRLGTELRETLSDADTSGLTRDGWRTHQTIVTPWDYTDVAVPEGQHYLLTLNWRSTVGQLAFYGCTRQSPGPFDDEDLPGLSHPDVAIAAQGWGPDIIPLPNQLDPPQTVPELAEGFDAILPYYDAACSEGDTVRVKVFYDPATDDDIYVNERDVDLPISFSDLEIEKRASTDTPAAGSDLIYTLTIRNLGPDDATDVVVTDVLPPGVTYDGDTDGCVEGPVGTLTCTVGDLAAGGSTSFAILVSLDPGLAAGTELINSAAVGSPSTIDPDPSNNQDDATVIVTGSADLSITKGASDVTPVAGQQLVYLIAVTNNGPSLAEDVVVVDTLPAGVTYVSNNAGCVQAPIGTITCQLGDMAAGAVRNVAITVMVGGGVAPGTALLNVATVDSSTDDPDPSDNTDDAAVIVTVEADLSVAKTSSSSTVFAGDLVTFTIQVSNAGPSNAAAVEVVDTLPAGLTYVSSTAACVQSPVGTLTCQLGALAAGASTSFDIVARAGALLPAGTQLTNVVVVDAPGVDDPDPSDDDDSTTVTVEVEADLSIDKRAPGAVVAGDSLVYTIEVTNLGPSQATGVVVTDVLPAGVTFVSSTGGCVQGPVGTLTCALGDIAPGGVRTFTVTVTVGAGLTVGTQLVNTASVDATSDDPNDANDEDETTTTVALRTQADLSIEKRASATARPGGLVIYLLRVENGGPSTATDVEVEDVLPAGVSFVSASPGCANTPPGSQTVTCDLGDMAPGAFRNLVITGQVGGSVPIGAVLTNTAQVDGTSTDPDPSDNTDSASTTVTQGGGGGGDDEPVDVSVEKSAAATVAPGATLIYSLRVENESATESATGVVVSDLLPDGVSYVSDTSPGGCDAFVGDPSMRVCVLGTLTPGQVVNFTITVAVDGDAEDGDPLLNMVAVSADQPDPVPGNNLDNALTTVDDDGGTGNPLADLAISKVASQPTVMAGDMLVYTVTVQNLGPSLVPQVIVTDTLPAGVTYLSDNLAPGGVSGCTQGPPLRLVCPMGSMASGATRAFQIMVQVDAGVAAGSVLTNTAVVGQPGPTPFALDAAGAAPDLQGPVPDPNLGNNTATATVNVATQADLGLDKDALTLNPAAGSQLAFELAVKNAGPSDAQGVVLTDVLPAGLTYVSSTAACDTSGLPELSCALGTIAAGATRIVTLTVSVGAGVAPGTTLTNEAEVSSATPDPDLSDNEDDASVVVGGGGGGTGADLLITKAASDTTPQPGEVVTFTIRVINNGPQTAQAVTVTDTLPAGLTYLSNSDSCSTAALPTLVCTLNQIASGVAVEFDVVVQVGAGIASGTTITNIASVGSTTEDPNPGNNETARSLLVTVPPNNADLTVRKTASSLTVTAGELVTFTIVVTNTGPADAANVTLTDVLPAGLEYVSDNAGCNTAALPTLTCALGAIPDETARTITLVAMVSPSLATDAQLTNTASAAAASPPDPDPSDNSSSATVLVQRRSDLKVTKTVAPNPVTAGGQAVFTIQVDNLGPSDAGPVTVTDVLPAGLSHVSNTGGCSTASLPTITCNLGTIAAGAFKSVQITVQVAVGTAGAIPNTATVSSPSDDPVPGNNSSTAIVNVVSGPTADLRIVKGTFDVDPAPGEQVTYNLQVFNDGPSTAESVVVTDTLPANVTYVSNSAGCSTANLPTLSCVLGNLASGAQTSFNIVVTVNPGVADDTVVVNTAHVSSGTADPDPSDNSDGAQFTVNVRPGAPTNANCSVIGGNQIRIAWLDGSTFENEFLLEVSIGGSAFVPLDVVGSTTQAGTGTEYMYMTAPLPAATSYRFRVLARNTISGTTSSYSNLTATCTTAGGGGTNAGCYRGKIELQGRSDHGGVLIYMDKMPVAITDASGHYEFCGVPPGKHKIKAATACYLNALSGTDLQPQRTLVMPFTALPGGDTNNNGRIDIYDLVKVGAAYRTSPPSDPAADCTGDHSVNLFDLVMVGSNFGRVGPVPFGFDPFGLGTQPAAARGPLDVPATTLEAVAEALGDAFGPLEGGAQPAVGPGTTSRGALRPSDPGGTPLGLRVVAQDEDEVTIQIVARGIRGLYGADVQLGYDPKQVEVIDALVAPGVQVEPGEAFASGVGLVAENRADAEAGTVDFAATRLDPAPALDGDVVLATVRLRKLVAEPADAWRLTEAILLDRDAKDLPVRLEGTDIVATEDWTRGEFVIALPFLGNAAELESTPQD